MFIFLPIFALELFSFKIQFFFCDCIIKDCNVSIFRCFFLRRGVCSTKNIYLVLYEHFIKVSSDPFSFSKKFLRNRYRGKNFRLSYFFERRRILKRFPFIVDLSWTFINRIRFFTEISVLIPALIFLSGLEESVTLWKPMSIPMDRFDQKALEDSYPVLRRNICGINIPKYFRLPETFTQFPEFLNVFRF